MRCAAHLAAILEFCGGGILTTSLEPIAGDPVRLVDAADVIRPEAGAMAEEALSWLTATPLLRSLSDNQWQFASQATPGIPRRHPPQGPAARPGQRPVAPVRGSRPRTVRPPPAPGPRRMARLVPARGLPGDPHARPRVPSSARTCPRSPLPCARRSLTRCSPMRSAAGGCPAARSLHRVGHPGLRGQLAAKITPEAAWQPGGASWPVRLAIAMSLARACPDQAPAGALLDVAEDDQTPAGIRAAALEAVPAGAATEVAGRLDALAGDPEAEVAAGALLALWPRQLPTAALLARMPASAPESAWQRIALRLDTADAGAVLAWLQAQFKDGTVASPTGVMRLLTWACFTLRPAEGEEPQQPAAAGLADVLVLLLRSDRAYDVHLTDIRDPGPAPLPGAGSSPGRSSRA